MESPTINNEISSSLRATGSQPIPTRTPDPVISDAQTRTIADQRYEMREIPSTSGAGVTVTTNPNVSTSAQALEALIEARLGGIAQPKQRNQEHMVNFLNALNAFDRDATAEAGRRTNETALNNAVPHFIRTYFATRAEVDGPQKTAGRILNMHNWMLEVNQILATAAIWALAMGVEFTKQEPADPTNPPPVPKSTLPGVVPSAVGLPILLLLMYINGNKGAKDIQHALVMQRATRTLTPTRAGGLVDLEGARQSMRGEHDASRQLLARGHATLEELQGALTGLELSRDNYDEQDGTLKARSRLYFTENVVKAAKAAILTGASLSTIFSSGARVARVLPQVLIAQALAYPAGWVANYKWAGPARDESLRDGALKVDFEKDGVTHAKRLSAAQGGSVITHVPADDPVWDWGRGIHKNPVQTRLEMMQTRIVEKIEDALHGMSQATGISDDDLLRFQALMLKQSKPEGLDDGERLAFRDLFARFNNSPAERDWRAGVTSDTPYPTHRQAWESWNADLGKVAAHLEAAARDEPTEVWKTLSPDAKEMLNNHLSPYLHEGAVRTYIEYLKGSNSGNEFVRTTREVANVTRRDPRQMHADINLKLNRPFAYLGFGGSLGTILKGQVAAIVKYTTNYALPNYASALVSGALFGLYLNEIFKQGQAVNLTISQKENNKAAAPSKHDGANLRDFAKYFVRGMFITSFQGVSAIKGAAERRRVIGDIRAIHHEIAAVQARLQAGQAGQAA